MKKKKILAFGLTCALVASVGVGLSACGKDDDPSGSAIDAQDFYAMAAISSANFLQEETLTSNQMFSVATADTRPDSISQSDVNNIANYMRMFQDMLASDTNKYYTNGAVGQEDGEYASKYNLKMTMTLPTLDGEDAVITLYYKETNTSTNEEVDDGEVELEINTTLEGEIVYGDETLSVTGKREYEKEGNETDVSLEFRAESKTNPDDYILIEHEAEDNEVEFNYTTNKGGIFQETEVEFENERREKSLELEFISASGGNQERVKYEITQSNSNQNQFNVELKNATGNNAVKERFTVTKDSTGYVFSYSNGYSETVAY